MNKDKLLTRIQSVKDWIMCNKKRTGQICLIILILIFALSMKFAQNHKESLTVEASESDLKGVDAYVDISGEINEPGIYKVDEDTRLFELIDKAGGLTANANLDAINQAEYVEDGQKIIIPAKSISNTATGIDSNGLININTASQVELMELSGVGEAIATRIIEYRSNNTFKTIDDIKNVKGIGDATFEKIKDKITI